PSEARLDRLDGVSRRKQIRGVLLGEIQRHEPILEQRRLSWLRRTAAKPSLRNPAQPVIGGVRAAEIPMFYGGRAGQSNAFRIEPRRTPRRCGVTKNTT